MNEATAERWVVISAVTVAGIYAYRRVIEPSSPPATAKKLLGVGTPPPLGTFATAWGFVYLVVAAMATAAPGLGGGFAILIMTSYILTNTAELTQDITKQEKGAGTSSQAGVTPGTFDTPTGPAPYKPPPGIPLTGNPPAPGHK